MINCALSNNHHILETLFKRNSTPSEFNWCWKCLANSILPAFAFLLFLSRSGFAQPGMVLSSREMISWDKTRREIHSRNLGISQAEASAFWKTYEEYERTRRSLLKEYSELISEYAFAPSEARIHRISKRLLENKLYYDRIYKDYYKRLKVIVGPRQAIRFIGMEKYFQESLKARIDSLTFYDNPILAKGHELPDGQ
jgi:hypothetical protein